VAPPHHRRDRGHAFEARIYAEQPENDFLPGSGTVEHLRTPPAHGDTYATAEARASVSGAPACRLDISVAEGDDVSVCRLHAPLHATL